MNKYKILLVVYYPIGGIRTFFRYVYKNFDPERYHFTLVSPDLPETQLLINDLASLNLVYLPINREASIRSFFKSVTGIIKNNKFDLIHSHGFTSGVVSVWGVLWKRTPHILTCHDVFNEKQFYGINGFFKRIFLGFLLSTISCIHCVSYDGYKNLLEFIPMLRIFKNKLVVIPNGIEVELFLCPKVRDLRNELNLSEDTYLIGFLGRFMSQKGFKYLVDAFERIYHVPNKERKPVLLCFSQEDGFIREEKEIIEKKKLTDSIIFLPFIPNVASTLKGLDVVAMPSLWEACGLLAMEAMVSGVPLIGTNCIGLREVLKDTPAIIVPVRDSILLAEALVEEMRKPSTIEARKFVEVAASRFDVLKQSIELEKLMNKFIAK